MNTICSSVIAQGVSRWFLVGAFALLGMSVAGTGAVMAAEASLNINLKPVQGADIARNIPQGKKAGRYDVAVLIANKNYQHSGVPAVEYAHNDLKVMRKYLEKTLGYSPENILVEKDATKGTFETLFGTRRTPRGKLSRYVRKGKSKVFIYYVGHGAPDPEAGDGYFVPVDADPDYIGNSGYPLSIFYANLKKVQAKEMVVVIDACFSGRTPKGLLFKNVSPALVRVKETPAGIGSGAVFTSAQGEQLSTWYPQKKHSLFTYYFLKGLQGGADADGDRNITMAELNTYVGEEVEYWAGRIAGKTQQPKLEGKTGLVLATFE